MFNVLYVGIYFLIRFFVFFKIEEWYFVDILPKKTKQLVQCQCRAGQVR